MKKEKNYTKNRITTNPYANQRNQNTKVKTFTESWQEYQNSKNNNSNNTLDELTRRLEKMEIKLLEKL